jgi:hypothetical protein
MCRALTPHNTSPCSKPSCSTTRCINRLQQQPARWQHLLPEHCFAHRRTPVLATRVPTRTHSSSA